MYQNSLSVILCVMLTMTQCVRLQVLDGFYQQFLEDSSCLCKKEMIDVYCECKGRQLKEFPDYLPPKVSRIIMMSVGIEVLRNTSLKKYAASLEDLHIEGALELRVIEAGVLHNCTKLRTLHITRAPKLKQITNGVFDMHLPQFRMLRIAHSGLEIIPNLTRLKTDPTIISMIDFDSNKIRNITSFSVKVQTSNLILDYNDIEVIENYAFHGSIISNLSIKGNKNLRLIADDGFTALQTIRSLDVSETLISRLPTHGLDSLEVLKMKNVDRLWKFPSVLHFPELKEAHLTYPYHCCAFQFPTQHDPLEFMRLQALRMDVHRTYCEGLSSTTTPPAPTAGRSRRQFDYDDDGTEEVVYGKVVYTPSSSLNETSGWMDIERIEDIIRKEGCQQPEGMEFPSHNLNDIESLEFASGDWFHAPVSIPPPRIIAICGNITNNFRQVRCFPEPDAFNPCEDVMGKGWLRVAVWFVLVAAVLGNLAVLVVILSSRATLSVSKFLMCHLAFADFCMGLYLLIIASVDVRTMGTYFNHAIEWQHGPGCQMAGFLTVFSSELSIFTLTLITLERWYAITYAIHLNRRLHLGTAAKVMVIGWLYALGMAALPVLGVSSYSRTSTCLPMENEDLTDLAYLVALLASKAIAFLLICTCYAKMYLSIRVSGKTGNRDTPDLHANRAVRSDLSVAKRMAMLVFTDFACWAPIAFFGLTAVSGRPLIDVTHSKILLVFFLPLNSCSNPFLYAILTKQYRRDARSLLARCGRRRRSCVQHGRTLSTNTHRHVSSVKALYRSSLANNPRQQVILPSTARRLPGVTQSDGAAKEYYMPGHRSPASFSSSRSREGSPAVHRGSPHPIKNSYTKLQHPDQQLILRRVLEYPPPSTASGGSQSNSHVTTGDHTTDTTTDGPVSYDDGGGDARTSSCDTAV